MVREHKQNSTTKGSTMQSYQLNINKNSSVIFEAGDVVTTEGTNFLGKNTIDSFFTNGNAKLITGVVVPVYKLRFVSNTPENAVRNAHLRLYQHEFELKKYKEELKNTQKKYKGYVVRRNNLKKSGLCDTAINSQLVHEFPELF